jgi:alkanesulfonate monooxygenase SsuD/methylene tetrahydromethanopterin reductase-like flavin-dependent oxidoreductase (luciferase family)
MTTSGAAGTSLAGLAGLARDTNTIRLGTLVTSATFRHPGLLAVQVAQVDEISGGRVERLEEQLAIITGLWQTPVGERFTHEGRHYMLVDSPALPKPVQTPVPIVIGGTGRRRTPELAGRHASDFNLPFVSVQESAGLFENVRVVAGAAGRDLSTLTLSNALAVCAGRDDTEARRSHWPRPGPVAQRRPRWIAGRNRRQDRPVLRCGYQPDLSSGARPA